MEPIKRWLLHGLSPTSGKKLNLAQSCRLISRPGPCRGANAAC